jgi:hypothetical protein
MSIANNELHKLPVEVLEIVSFSLQYLSLANNPFDQLFETHNDTFRNQERVFEAFSEEIVIFLIF